MSFNGIISDEIPKEFVELFQILHKNKYSPQVISVPIHNAGLYWDIVATVSFIYINTNSTTGYLPDTSPSVKVKFYDAGKKWRGSQQWVIDGAIFAVVRKSLS